jgi:hypothetical protein
VTIPMRTSFARVGFLMEEMVESGVSKVMFPVYHLRKESRPAPSVTIQVWKTPGNCEEVRGRSGRAKGGFRQSLA